MKLRVLEKVKTTAIYVLLTGTAFAQKGDQIGGGEVLKEETKKAAEAVSTFLTILLGGGTIVLVVGAIVMSMIMGYKAYQTSKDQRDTNPTLNGIKTFALWAVGSMVVLAGLVFGADNILGGAVMSAVERVIGIGTGAE